MNEVLLLFGMFLVTFGVRYPVLALVGKIPLPDPIFKALKFVPPAVLAAIIMPALILPNGNPDITFTNPPLIAGIFSGIIAWRTKNLLLTIVLGMLFFWLWRWGISSEVIG
jgi:branched-subunit amino acid transport protein